MGDYGERSVAVINSTARKGPMAIPTPQPRLPLGTEAPTVSGIDFPLLSNNFTHKSLFPTFLPHVNIIGCSMAAVSPIVLKTTRKANSPQF